MMCYCPWEAKAARLICGAPGRLLRTGLLASLGPISLLSDNLHSAKILCSHLRLTIQAPTLSGFGSVFKTVALSGNDASKSATLPFFS